MGHGEYLSSMHLLSRYLCILLCSHTSSLSPLYSQREQKRTLMHTSSVSITKANAGSASHISFYVWVQVCGFQFRAGSCPARSEQRQSKWMVFKQKACMLTLMHKAHVFRVSTSLKSNLQMADLGFLLLKTVVKETQWLLIQIPRDWFQQQQNSSFLLLYGIYSKMVPALSDVFHKQWVWKCTSLQRQDLVFSE